MNFDITSFIIGLLLGGFMVTVVWIWTIGILRPEKVDTKSEGEK